MKTAIAGALLPTYKIRILEKGTRGSIFLKKIIILNFSDNSKVHSI